jgi:hypothetical protein
MLAANPQRTSWVSEEVRGNLRPLWWKRMDAYLSQKVQPVAAYDTLYLATAGGLWALDAETGRERWVYRTELPLGHSPTLYDGVAYVGGFDRRIHAVDARTGKGLWTFTGGAGFQVNPLLVDGVLYAGCRDGCMYAIDIATHQQLWKTDVGAPIQFSAAYRDGRIFFGTTDGYACALDARTGQPVWKSHKFPGAGFRSYWPVVYRDRVAFYGSNAYNMFGGASEMGIKLNSADLEAYPDKAEGALVGPRRADGWVDASAFLEYFRQKPYRRTAFVLDIKTSQEREVPPLIWAGDDGAANRFPPVVGGDGNLWQHANLVHAPPFSGRAISGWEPGTPFLSTHHLVGAGGDEAHGLSAAGNLIYWDHNGHRDAGAFDCTQPCLSGKARGAGADRSYATYYTITRGELVELFGILRGENAWRFAYGFHGDRSGPVPYKGKVYIVVYNGLVALGPKGREAPAEGRGKYTAREVNVTSDVVKPSKLLLGPLTHVALDGSAWPALVQRQYYQSGRGLVDYYALCRIAASAADKPASAKAEGENRCVAASADGKTLEVTASNRAPGVLCQTDSQTYRIVGKFVGLGYTGDGGVKVLDAPGRVDGAAMAQGWILAWFGPEGHPFDYFHPRGQGAVSRLVCGHVPPWSPTPVLLSLQNRPRSVELAADAVRLTFAEAAGAMVVTPLWGFHDNKPRAAEWAKGLPADVVDRCRLLHQAALAYPVAASDEWRIDPQSGDARLAVSVTHRVIEDQWRTAPLKLAYLAPPLALAAWGGSPIRADGELVDLGYPVMLGRLAGVRGAAKTTVTLPGLARYWREDVPPPARPAAGGRWQAALAAEVRKMLAAGHLRPGYMSSGAMDWRFAGKVGDSLNHYFHNPADTIATLLRALPLLPADMQEPVKAYVRQEYEKYPPHSITHVGWAEGAARERFALPDDVDKGRAASKAGVSTWPGWGFSPDNFYALWLYAREFGGAGEIFGLAGRRLQPPRFPASMPYVINTYIAGYIGYIRLAALAGETTPVQEEELARLLVLRAALTKNAASLAEAGYDFGGYGYAVDSYDPGKGDIDFQITAIGAARQEIVPWSSMGGYPFTIDFVNLTPESGRFLRDYAGRQAAEAVADHADRAPYWFVAWAEEFINEGTIVPLYDVPALFQARAMILQQPRAELEKYLDVPGFAVGDLFYVQNLCATLEARP